MYELVIMDGLPDSTHSSYVLFKLLLEREYAQKMEATRLVSILSQQLALRDHQLTQVQGMSESLKSERDSLQVSVIFYKIQVRLVLCLIFYF